MRRGLSYHNRRSAGGYNPFSQLGPTLDLIFAGIVTNLSDPNGFTLDANFLAPQYLIGEQYIIWGTGVGLVSKTFSQIITFTRASTGTFVGSNGLIQSAAIDAPRFDYDPVTLAAKGLLIEEQRTNLLTYSQDFSNVTAWPPTNITVTNAATTAPDGTNTAQSIAATTTASTLLVSATATVSATSATYSVYVKQGTGANSANTFTLRNSTAATNLLRGTLNYSTGVFTYSIGSTGVSVQNVGNGWWRLIMTVTSGVTSGDSLLGYVGFSGDSETAGTFLYAWGAQLETGSFATSYIPTVASQVTRSADVAAVNTLSPWYNATEGTLYAEFTPYGVTSDVRFASIDDNTSANRILIWGSSSSSSTRYEVLTGGAAQVTLTAASTLTANATTKSAAAYKVNDFAFSVNGGTAVLDGSGTVPAVTKLTIGGNAGTTMSNGAIRRITYYPRRLSNAELQAITA